MNIVSYPNAKVNLGLRIIEKRPDGFHNLETLFVPTGLCDILEIVTSNIFSIKHYGLTYSLPDANPEEDLCVRAYRLLQRDYDLPPVEIHLYKKIPVGAGLGGGSADAAFTLKSLNSLFKLNLSDEALASYAARLGSDCPFFVYNKPMFGEGRGEILTPYQAPWIDDLFGEKPRYKIETRTFPIHVSTAEAYRGVVPRIPEVGLEELLRGPITNWQGSVRNDFEPHIFAAHPAIRSIKESLLDSGALYASMSGSGSAVFGLFTSQPQLLLDDSLFVHIEQL